MSKSYVIEWKSLVNGRAGRGTKVFELEEARQLAEELNREYPGIHHEPVESPESQPAPVPAEAEIPQAQAEPEVAPGLPELNHSPDHAFSFE
ncbi:MAG TPA: hypothetical protein VKY92_21320 [Verrucomicrobiae bacterium]|nr:hypothetical protein [Verrucomicrobiae bacterium]